MADRAPIPDFDSHATRSLRPGRRGFLRTAVNAAAATITATWTGSADAAEQPPESLAGVVGITTGGLNYQLRQGMLTLLTLPKFMRDELGMQLIDVNTRWLTSFEEAYLQRVRQTAEDAKCYFTNLKVNHSFGDLYSRDPQERAQAMAQGQQLVEVAKTLGARWIRFTVARAAADDNTGKLIAHRELANFARQRGVQLLIENTGWMKSEPDSIARLVKTIGHRAAPGPDTGNWDDKVRYDALAQSFPGAVTCDFKVFELDANRRHRKYDIQRCFDIAWQAGFRGPWAIEHWNEDTKAFARETVFLRDQLKKWTAAAG